MARVTPGSNAGERYWEGEGISGRGMTGGTGRSVREREGGGGNWVGLASRVRPKWAASIFLLFFSFCYPFSFVLISVLSFLKKLFYSDLNKIKADHFWSLKVCSQPKDQRFSDMLERKKKNCKNFNIESNN
jgi:hypothetical protein